MKPTLSPSSHIQANSGIGSTQTALSKTQGKILEILGMEDLEGMEERIESILEALKKEITRKSLEIGYDYEDYEQRLWLDEAQKMQIFQQKILSDLKLQHLYESLIERNFDDASNEILRQRLFDQFIEDLLYESFDEPQYKQRSKTLDFSRGNIMEIEGEIGEQNLEDLQDYDEIVFSLSQLERGNDKQYSRFCRHLAHIKKISLNGNISQELPQERVECLLSGLESLEVLKIQSSHLTQLSHEKLESISHYTNRLREIDLSKTDLGNCSNFTFSSLFEGLCKVQRMNLAWCELYKVDREKMALISKPLSGVRSLNLRGNRLDDIRPHILEVFFANLTGLRLLKIGKNDLHDMSHEQCQTIFGHLANLRSLCLVKESLYNCDTEKLEIIFSAMPHLKHLDLEYTRLEKMSISQLTPIFSNISGIVNLNLGYNELGIISEAGLGIIFENLKNLKSIHLISVEEPLQN